MHLSKLNANIWNMKKENTDSTEQTNANSEAEIENHDSLPPESENQPESAATDAVLGDIATDLTSSMPAVQEHAIDLEETKKAEFSEQFAHLVDKNGTAFDPAIHKTKKDGTPTISKTGKLMLKPNAQAKVTTDSASPSSAQISSQPEQKSDETPKVLTEQEKQQCAALGKVSANALFSVGRAFGGDEWVPVKKQGYDEAAAMEQAFADYYEASGKTEMSPGAALTIAIGAYVMPRFTQPQTQQKSKNLAKRLYAWWNQRKGKKQAEAAAQAEEYRKSQEKKEITIEA